MSYARFFALLKRLPVDTEGVKEELVRKYTGGRTDSLREMTEAEYNAMCNALDASLKSSPDHLKRRRSTVLRLMQKLDIDTTDWARVNAFCRDARIAGKEFGRLDMGELEDVAVKLRLIERKGGLSPADEQPKETAPGYVLISTGEQLPN